MPAAQQAFDMLPMICKAWNSSTQLLHDVSCFILLLERQHLLPALHSWLTTSMRSLHISLPGRCAHL